MTPAARIDAALSGLVKTAAALAPMVAPRVRAPRPPTTRLAPGRKMPVQQIKTAASALRIPAPARSAARSGATPAQAPVPRKGPNLITMGGNLGGMRAAPARAATLPANSGGAATLQRWLQALGRSTASAGKELGEHITPRRLVLTGLAGGGIYGANRLFNSTENAFQGLADQRRPTP